jgi:hypothetical protein
LISIADAERLAGAVDYSNADDQTLPVEVLASESFKDESAASTDLYPDGEGKNAGDPSSASVTQSDPGQSPESVDGARRPQIGREGSASLSAEPDSEREALSVTNDV